MAKKIACDCENCDLQALFYDSVMANELEAICYQKAEKGFKKGERIIQAGDQIQEFIYLKKGLVKLYKTTDDVEQIISIAKPLDFVSMLSIFSGNNYNYSVSAIEDSITCNLEFDLINDLIKTNGTFAKSVLKRMSLISDKIILDNLAIRRKHLKGRVAFVLLYFADTIYFSDEFELPISRREVAEFIGMTTENVIRTLSEFRKDEIIKINGKIIEIVDKQKLKNISSYG